MGRNKKERAAAQREGQRAGSAADAPAGPGTGWYAAKGPALRFVLVSAGLMALFYAVFYTSPEDSPRLDAFIRSYLALYAAGSGFLLDLLGFETTVRGTLLVVDGRAVEVVRGCDAMEPIAFFVAAVIAIQVPWRAKLAGIGLGVPLLVLLNLLRILVLALVSAKLPHLFEAAHVTVAQTLFVLCTICLWFVWVLRATRAESRGHALAPG